MMNQKRTPTRTATMSRTSTKPRTLIKSRTATKSKASTASTKSRASMHSKMGATNALKRKAPLVNKKDFSHNHEDLRTLFVEELESMLDSENQAVKFFPILKKIATSQDLKEVLSNHLRETKEQVKRIRQIFSILNMKIHINQSPAVKGLLSEARDLSRHKKSSTLDAAIIGITQKMKHYEIASYGTLRSFAYYLGYTKEILNLLQENLNEEGAADKQLTKIAESGLFFSGINQEAVAHAVE